MSEDGPAYLPLRRARAARYAPPACNIAGAYGPKDSTKERTMEEKTQLQKDIEELVRATKGMALALPPLLASYRSGGATLGHVYQGLEAYIKVVVKEAGDLWPSLEDAEQRPAIIEGAILITMDMVGFDPPGPNKLYVKVLVQAGMWAWREARMKRTMAPELAAAGA